MEAANKTVKTLNTRALTAGIISARILAGLSFLVILCLWFLVPNDPDLSDRMNILLKLKPISLFSLAAVGLLVFSRWCTGKKNQRRSTLDSGS